MKKVVVDRQSATMTILLNGRVGRVLPFRIISDDTIVVGDRLFSGPLPDLRKWEESQSSRDRRTNGWDMRPGDKPTFAGTLPVKPFCFHLVGPREKYVEERECLLRYMGSAGGDELKALSQELDILDRNEEFRRKNAERQSRRKRPPKAEREKPKHGPSESGSSGSGKKKSKKKSKAKDNAGAQGEKSGNRKGRQKK